MNKFFTLVVGVILVLVGKGIVWGQMTTETISQPPLIPVATTTSSGLPKPLDLSRFDALGKKSPFTLASATAEADFAKELVLGGYVRMDGEDFVIVANKTKPERIMVGRKPSPSAQGMVLQDLKKDPSGDPSKLQAKIKKGTEMATLKYEITGGGGGTCRSNSCCGSRSTSYSRSAWATAWTRSDEFWGQAWCDPLLPSFVVG